MSKKNDWGLTEDEMDRLDDAVEAGILSTSDIMESREDLKRGLISVSELINIHSS